MSTTDSVNYTPAFKISTAKEDQFSRQDQINMTADLEGHDHSSGKGLAVKRVASGALASRPAAGNVGHVYVPTDEAGFYHDAGVLADGTRWIGHVIPIGSATVASPQATLTLQGTLTLPTGFRHLMGEVYVRSTTSAFFENLQVIFNADSGANYNYCYMSSGSGGTNLAAVESTSSNFGFLGVVPASLADAHHYAHVTFKIPYYQSTGYKVVTFQSVKTFHDTPGGGTEFQVFSGSIVWKSTAAITSMTFSLPGAGSIDVGSMFTLYGLP